jgi:hypothetical protein
MSSITDFPPETLFDRHGLSLQQINAIFGKTVIRESFEEKAAALAKVAEFLRVTDAFSAEGISFIPLKGPLLSYRLYGDGTWRRYCDLDIMVDITSVSRGVQLLSGLGYMSEYHTWPESKCGQRVITNHMHHVFFSHPINELNIELHWRLFQTPAAGISKLENLVKANQSVESFAGRSYTVLSNELELLYLVMHGSIHSWRRLKWLVDAEAYLRTRTIDWKLFERLVTELKAERLVSVGKSILSEYFTAGSLVPFDFYSPLFMKEFALEKIREPEDSGHESLKMTFKRWRYSFLSYPGTCYKINRVSYFMQFYSYRIFRKAPTHTMQ